MNEIKTLKGKITNCFSYGELSVICEKINNEVKDRVVINNVRTNTIANPKSALNMLNLSLINGDEVEIIIISDSNVSLNKSVSNILNIFKDNIVFYKE